MANKLAELLMGKPGLQLTPSPTRSAIVAQLLQQAQQQAKESMSPVESLNIASKPILAALLAKREERAQQQQQGTTDARRAALAGQLARTTQDGTQGQAARMAALVTAGGLPDDPVAQTMLAQQAQNALAPTGAQANERQVHSVVTLKHEGQPDTYGIVNAFTQQIEDTGLEVGDRSVIREGPGGETMAIDPRNPNTAPVIVQPRAEAQEGAADMASVTREATDTAAANVKLRQEAPNKLLELASIYSRNAQVLSGLEAGEFDSGPLVGRFDPITAKGQELQQFAGENVIDSISSATFGALSEGEREFLTTTTVDRKKHEEVNAQILKRRLEIVKNQVSLGVNQYVRAGGDLTTLPDEVLRIYLSE